LGIIAKQSVYNALYTYIGIGLGFITTIFLYPHILDPDQYGLTRVLISASMIGAQFAHLGIRNTIIRFFPVFEKSGKKQHSLLFLSLIIPLAGFLVFSLFFWLFRDFLIDFYVDRSPLFVDFYIYILPVTFFILYFDVLNSYLRSLRDSITGSLISEVVLRSVVILILAVYFFGLVSFQTFILLFALAYGIQPLLLIITLIRLDEFRITPRFTVLRKTLARGMASYGLYTLLGGLTTVIVWNVDILMLGSLSGLEQTAIYAIAFYIGTVITVPQRAIEKIATPLIADLIHQRNWGEVEKIYRKTSLNQTIAGTLILLLVWVNTEQLLNLLPDVYADGRYVVLFIGLGKLFDMATGINGSIIVNSKYYRFDLFTNLLLILFTVSSNLILIPEYGIQGAAIATMLSIFLYNLIKYIFVWIKFSMQPFSLNYLWLILFSAISLLLISMLPELTIIPNIMVTSVILVLLYVFPVWWLKLSDDFNLLIRQIMNKVIH
jgi:O-antigen/teichoic acid export membrane protein